MRSIALGLGGKSHLIVKNRVDFKSKEGIHICCYAIRLDDAYMYIPSKLRSLQIDIISLSLSDLHLSKIYHLYIYIPSGIYQPPLSMSLRMG